MAKVLVVGAREGSLGEGIINELRKTHRFTGVAAGPGAGRDAKSIETLHMDVTEPQSILDVIALVDPTHIVVTAGVPSNVAVGEVGFRRDFEEAFRVNVFGVIDVLNIWLQWLDKKHRGDPTPRHFVAISSNSAHIARTSSAGYCASKAALSMALRVAAREQARAGYVRVYGYEPGLLSGTPMTAATREALGPITPMTRMQGLPTGLSVADLSQMIAAGLDTDGKMLQGCMLRLDAGEQ